MSAQVSSLKSKWVVLLLVFKSPRQWFLHDCHHGKSLTFDQNLKCEQSTKFWKVVEHCGLLAQVSKAGLANVCNRGFYSTYLSPKSGKCRKNKLSQILPDIPYQTSKKPQHISPPSPQHISPPSLARSSAAKLVKGKGTSTKTRSNKLLVYILWFG